MKISGYFNDVAQSYQFFAKHGKEEGKAEKRTGSRGMFLAPLGFSIIAFAVMIALQVSGQAESIQNQLQFDFTDDLLLGTSMLGTLSIIGLFFIAASLPIIRHLKYLVLALTFQMNSSDSGYLHGLTRVEEETVRKLKIPLIIAILIPLGISIGRVSQNGNDFGSAVKPLLIGGALVGCVYFVFVSAKQLFWLKDQGLDYIDVKRILPASCSNLLIVMLLACVGLNVALFANEQYLCAAPNILPDLSPGAIKMAAGIPGQVAFWYFIFLSIAYVLFVVSPLLAYNAKLTMMGIGTSVGFLLLEKILPLPGIELGLVALPPFLVNLYEIRSQSEMSKISAVYTSLTGAFFIITVPLGVSLWLNAALDVGELPAFIPLSAGLITGLFVDQLPIRSHGVKRAIEA